MRALIFSILVSLLLGCKPVVEPVAFGEYFVTNNTSSVIVLTAFSGSVEVALTNDMIDPGQKSHIYSIEVAAGGHVMPSNAFTSFTVYSESIDPSNIIYSKVDNEDWNYEGVDYWHLVYHLEIN
jgi:hypothetical protein